MKRSICTTGKEMQKNPTNFIVSIWCQFVMYELFLKYRFVFKSKFMRNLRTINSVLLSNGSFILGSLYTVLPYSFLPFE